MVDFLLDQEVILEQKHGIPYCPCQGLTKKREENMKIVCPCIPFHRDHFDSMRRCWCGLFVHKDVTNPDELKQIPNVGMLMSHIKTCDIKTYPVKMDGDSIKIEV